MGTYLRPHEVSEMAASVRNAAGSALADIRRLEHLLASMESHASKMVSGTVMQNFARMFSCRAPIHQGCIPNTRFENIGSAAGARSIFRLDMKFAAQVGAVYALTLGNNIQYVGQSVQLPSRIASHIREGRIPFDDVYFFFVEEEYLSIVERYAIADLQPPFNRAGVTDKDPPLVSITDIGDGKPSPQITAMVEQIRKIAIAQLESNEE